MVLVQICTLPSRTIVILIYSVLYFPHVSQNLNFEQISNDFQIDSGETPLVFTRMLNKYNIVHCTNVLYNSTNPNSCVFLSRFALCSLTLSLYRRSEGRDCQRSCQLLVAETELEVRDKNPLPLLVAEIMVSTHDQESHPVL